MNTSEKIIETYTIFCYTYDGDLDGPFFFVFKDCELTEKEEQILSFWHEQNKQGMSSADCSVYNEKTATEEMKKCREMGVLISDRLENGMNHTHDITPFQPVSRFIKFLVW